jgi:hypothetical protein
MLATIDKRAARVERLRAENEGHVDLLPRQDGKQFTLWVDIEDATRPQMLWPLSNRRQQMVGDAVHLKIDEMIWNNRHPDDQEERLNSPGFGANDAAA